MKKCFRCKRVQANAEFPGDRSRGDGLRPVCRSCGRELNRAYREVNREKERARSIRYRETNAEKESTRKRAYYKANLEAAREYGRAHYWSNVEELRNYSRAYYAANIDERRHYRREYEKQNPEKQRTRSADRRARKLAAFVERVEPARVLELGSGLCGICRLAVDPKNFHIDHIVPLVAGGEHSYANTQPAHPLCNLSKGAKVGVAA